MIWDDKKYGSLPSPKKIDYTTIYVYKKGYVIIDNVLKSNFVSQVREYIKQEKIYAKVRFNSDGTNENIGQVKQDVAKAGYMVEEIVDDIGLKDMASQVRIANCERMDQYKYDLIKDRDVHVKLGEILFDRAYDNDHSSGMHQVEDEFDSLIEFAETIIASVPATP